MVYHRRANVIFTLCFALIGALFLGDHMIVEATIDRSDLVATMVDQNGRQRMLTERIANVAEEGRTDELAALAKSLQATHAESLRNLRLIVGAASLVPYLDEIDGLTISIEAFSAHALAGTPESLAYLTSPAKDELIATIDRMVATIKLILNAKMESDATVSDVIMFGGLFLMGLIAVLVMRPLMMLTHNAYALSERSRLLEAVVENAMDAIIITRATKGDQEPEIVYVNHALCQTSGYSREETVGRTPEFLLDPAMAKDTVHMVVASLQQGKAFRGEMLSRTKSGEARWLDLTAIPVMDERGVMTHFASFHNDITSRKKAESIHEDMLLQLRRMNQRNEVMTRQLEESLAAAKDASRAKDEFLANMSHEIRTPMNGVIGMAHLLADTELNGEQQDYVTAINGSAETLRMLLNDILDLSKIEAGVLSLESIPVDPVDTIRQTARLLLPLSQKKGLSLQLELGPQMPRAIISDPGRLRQILTNLIGNAVKFTETGHVQIFAGTEMEGDRMLLRLEVEDTGIGIADSKLQSIFDKFTQADASITRRYGGTGLGLAITRQLVELMGGTIKAESIVGRGSKFIVRLPLILTDASLLLPDTTETCPWSEHHLKPAAACRVLIVEDYPVNQVFARKLLEKFGFRTIELVSDGAQAVTKVRETAYDVIFMDCQMPELDGYQASTQIRDIEKGSGRHTPIIAMTANAMIGDREKCLKAGMDDYVSKPLRPELLKKALSRWIALPDKSSGTIPALPNGSSSMAQPNAAPSEPPSPSRLPPIDLEQLRSFTDGNREEEQAIAQLFHEQSALSLAELQRALEAKDLATWRSAAHRMKGASGNLGARMLAHLCKEAEGLAGSDSRFGPETLEAIRAEVAAVEAFLKSLTV